MLSQKQKSNNWLRDTARGTDLEIDDDMLDVVDGPAGYSEEVVPVNEAIRAQLEVIEKDRKLLKAMLARSSVSTSSGKLVAGQQQSKRSLVDSRLDVQRKKGRAFIVVAK